MDAKKALEESEGDFDKAVEVLRVTGAAKAAKRGAERTASAGLVTSSGNAMVELNCETDFVAKSDRFIELASEIVMAAERAQAHDADALGEVRLDGGKTVGEAIEAQAGVIGEKVQLGRVTYVDGQAATYLHRRASDLPPAVGVIVGYEGDDVEAARGAAMQIAAMRPEYLTREDVPADVVEKERAIAEAKAREEGKPEQAMPKIVEGRVNAFFKDVVLVEQMSVQDGKQSVQSVLDQAGVRVTRFARFEVGQD